MDPDCPILHLKKQPNIEMEEHYDLYFHALSHFTMHDCAENLFSFEYFSLISSLKKKLNQNPMDLIRSLDELYGSYQKEKSLFYAQFIPFCTDSTDGLFQSMEPSNSTFLDELQKDCGIDSSNNEVRRFWERFRDILVEEHHSFFQKTRHEIQRLTIDKDALAKLSDLCMGRGAKLFGTVHSMLNNKVHVYICPPLTEHARMMERKGDILIAIGDLRNGKQVVTRFLNIIHEASHRIVDALAVKMYLRMSSGLLTEDAETFHLVKEISVIYFNKILVSIYNPELLEVFDRAYDLDQIIKLFVKKGETYEKARTFQVFLHDYFENVFSPAVSYP